MVELEAKLAHVTASGNDIVISGANLYVNDGSGGTDGPVNGLGNVVIGYNELRGSGDERSGSHNLVVGSRNNYSSYGGLVGGREAETSTPFSIATRGTNALLGTTTGDFKLEADAAFDVRAGTSFKAEATSQMDLKANVLNVNASGNATIQSSGNATIQSAATLALKGSVVLIN